MTFPPISPLSRIFSHLDFRLLRLPNVHSLDICLYLQKSIYIFTTTDMWGVYFSVIKETTNIILFVVSFLKGTVHPKISISPHTYSAIYQSR